MDELPQRWTARMPALAGVVFTQAAADSLVGQVVQVKVRKSDGGEVLAEWGDATVVAAELVDGGDMLVTYERNPS